MTTSHAHTCRWSGMRRFLVKSSRRARDASSPSPTSADCTIAIRGQPEAATFSIRESMAREDPALVLQKSAPRNPWRRGTAWRACPAPNHPPQHWPLHRGRMTFSVCAGRGFYTEVVFTPIAVSGVLCRASHLQPMVSGAPRATDSRTAHDPANLLEAIAPDG